MKGTECTVVLTSRLFLELARLGVARLGAAVQPHFYSHFYPYTTVYFYHTATAASLQLYSCIFVLRLYLGHCATPQ